MYEGVSGGFYLIISMDLLYIIMQISDSAVSVQFSWGTIYYRPKDGREVAAIGSTRWKLFISLGHFDACGPPAVLVGISP